MTINRFCSSGLQSIAIAANQIASGQSQVAIAGGVDSISMRNRQTTGKAEQNKRLIEEKPEVFMAMGNTAEVVARRYQVTREMQDVYALQSQQRYANAVEQGWISEEIVPMNATMLKVDKETGDESRVEVSVDKDECNRPQTTLEGLSGLAPAFEEDGTVTAGNASQLSDGASMTMLMSSDRAAQLGIEPIGIIAALRLLHANQMRWVLVRCLQSRGCCRMRVSSRTTSMYGCLMKRLLRSASIVEINSISIMKSTTLMAAVSALAIRLE